MRWRPSRWTTSRTGFRFVGAEGFKGALAYTTDSYIDELDVPSGLRLGVMVNAGDLVGYPGGCAAGLERLFVPADRSQLRLVRLACHIQEFKPALPACRWLKERGYEVGINLMQIADRTDEEIENIAATTPADAVDVIYFADSLGGLDPGQTAHIVQRLRSRWGTARWEFTPTTTWAMPSPTPSEPSRRAPPGSTEQ